MSEFPRNPSISEKLIRRRYVESALDLYTDKCIHHYGLRAVGRSVYFSDDARRREGSGTRYRVRARRGEQLLP